MLLERLEGRDGDDGGDVDDFGFCYGTNKPALSPIYQALTRLRCEKFEIVMIRFLVCNASSIVYSFRERSGAPLFGSLVDTVLDCLSQPRTGLPVVIIQLAKINVYNAVHEIESAVEISIISQRPRAVSVRDEFMKLYPKKSIGQLDELVEDGNFIIMAIIAEIVNEKSWWYTACTCLKAVNFDRGYPFCSHCKQIVFDMSPRYKLKVLAIDGDEAAHFIMFDSECTLLLNKSFQELIGEQEVFQVRRVCCDSSIKTEYKDCVDDETPLKLKFAPLFTKMEQEEGNKCVLDLSPQCKSLPSNAETTPSSCGQSSSAGQPSSSGSKRDVEELGDESWELNKRARGKGVKNEGD
ncbi:Nucleic acid-binding, OB-fold [Sesbania bispinosa]|nr:Nucleic acid-binding, OB-fold [Sesbania bispinosa]